MKASGILKFFASIVVLLALLCLVFPTDGISLGGTRLYFPKLHNVLVREKTQRMEELLVAVKERDLTNARDSVDDCRSVLFESQTRVWLPDDDITYFDRFFEKAERAQSDGKIIRIVHYGDSQIEQDRISCRLRERMQKTFGGGGPGMLPLRQPIPTFSFNQSASGALKGLSTYGDSTFSRSNGNYGPMLRCWRMTGGVTMNLHASTNRMAEEGVKHFSTVRVLFNNRPGPLTVSMRNTTKNDITPEGATPTYKQTISESGIHMISWQMPQTASDAVLSLTGNADVYGVLVDDGPGVAVDNVSMRGVSGHQFTMVNAEQLAEAYSMMDIGIIIMQFGGNSVPYLKSDKVIENYCKRLGEQIDYVRRACPDAAILFIGPSDMSTKVNGRLASYPKLSQIVEQLKQMANEHGAAYWSIYDAMGGNNSMVTWVKNGYAGSDYIHFTVKGARIMGDYLSDMLLKLYELYKIRQQVTPEQFEKIWLEE